MTSSRNETTPIEFLRASAQQAERSNDWTQATKCYAQVLNLGSDAFWDRFFYARAVLYAGDFESAEQLISQLSPADAERSAVIMLRADLQERAGNFDAAKTLWGDGLSHGGSRYWCLFGIARATARLGDDETARSVMDQALAEPERESAGIQFAESLKRANEVVNVEASAGALVGLMRSRPTALSSISFDDLLTEVLYRLKDGENAGSGEERVAIAQELQERLNDGLEIHSNRFSIRHVADHYYAFHGALRQKPKIVGATILDVGSGSHNPLGLQFIFVLMGAHRAFALDIATIQDRSRALRAMARTADVLLTDPGRILGPIHIPRWTIEKNLEGFDLEAMRRGDERGVDRSRLQFVCGSVTNLPFKSSSIDIVTSNSFLEHIKDVDVVLQEIARVTVPGGIGIHNIDGNDHVAYRDPSCHPLDFLRIARPGMVDNCNRIRILEFPEMFGRHGFETRQVIPVSMIEVDDDLQNSFAGPWRQMPRNYLELAIGTIVVRRNGIVSTR